MSFDDPNARRTEWWRPAPQPDLNMRVSDAERHEVADQLSKHFADGRLDDAEFNERLDKAMSAKTLADLSGLLTDLPRVTEPTAVASRRPRRGPHLVVLLLAVVIAANLIRAAISPHVPVILLAVIVVLAISRRRRRRWGPFARPFGL